MLKRGLGDDGEGDSPPAVQMLLVHLIMPFKTIPECLGLVSDEEETTVV